MESVEAIVLQFIIVNPYYSMINSFDNLDFHAAILHSIFIGSVLSVIYVLKCNLHNLYLTHWRINCFYSSDLNIKFCSNLGVFKLKTHHCTLSSEKNYFPFFHYINFPHLVKFSQQWIWNLSFWENFMFSA